MLHRCNFPDGIGCAGFDGSAEEGRRNGSEPLGEAWLFEGAIWKSMLENLRYACRHFDVRAIHAQALQENIIPAISGMLD